MSSSDPSSFSVNTWWNALQLSFLIFPGDSASWSVLPETWDDTSSRASSKKIMEYSSVQTRSHKKLRLKQWRNKLQTEEEPTKLFISQDMHLTASSTGHSGFLGWFRQFCRRLPPSMASRMTVSARVCLLAFQAFLYPHSKAGYGWGIPMQSHRSDLCPYYFFHKSHSETEKIS